MKITTIFIFDSIFCLFFIHLNASTIKLNTGSNVTTAFSGAVDGDTIELSQSGVYLWTEQHKIQVPKSITIRAASNLTEKPTLKMSIAKATYFMFFYNLNTASGVLRLEGITIDGDNLVGSVVAVKCSLGYNVNIVMDNCVVKNLYNATTSAITAFTYSSLAPDQNPNPDSLIIKNSKFIYNGEAVFTSTGVGRPKNILVSNSYFKGQFAKGAFSNLVTSGNEVKSYKFDHCTFDGNNTADLRLFNIADDLTSTTTITNSVFANNTGTTENIMGRGGNLKNHCAVYFTGTSNTVYPDTLIDATTILENPSINSAGEATALVYINSATDGKNIGYFVEQNSTTDSKSTIIDESIVAYQNGSVCCLRGKDMVQSYIIYNLMGKEMKNGLIENMQIKNIDVLSKGIYLLKVGNNIAKLTIR